MKSLYFIRHGQSLANTGVKSLPDKDIPLTDLGISQIKNLLTAWQKTDIIPSQIYHSPLLRAKQSAMGFNKGFDLPLNELGLLKEFGCLSFNNICAMMGDERRVLANHYWQTAEIDFKDGADADSFGEFYDRVSQFLRVVDDFEHNSLFFGHGIWIGMLAWQLLGLDVKDNADMQRFRQFQTAMPMDNATVYRLDMAGGVRGLGHLSLADGLK